MAQFSQLLPVLVLFTLCKPIVCPYGHLSYDRRDRAPYIDSSEYNTQQLGQAAGTTGSRLRKPSTYTENNANYRHQEQQVEAPQVVGPPVHNRANPATHPNHRDEITTATAVEKNIRSIFKVNFGPGVHIFADKVETSTQDHIRKKETGPAYIVDSKDCVEGDAKSGKPFCTRLRNYPEQSHLEEIIKSKFNNLESFFGEDILLPQNISQRMNNEPIEEFLCRSRTRVIYPEAGLNKDYDWLFIINTKKYKQGVRIEECINEGSVCGENTGLTLPSHYKATCKQNYIYRSLVAYANETIVKDQFKMPSCCKCVLTIS